MRTRLKPVFIITKKGHKLFLDEGDSLHISVHKSWFPFETKILEQNIKKGDVVLDVGAHIGFYTLIMAEAVGECGLVYAFEPDLINFKLLKKNIESNGFKNIIPIQKAAGDKNTKLKLRLSKESGGHRLFKTDKNQVEKYQNEKVEEDFLNEIDVDVIKIDDLQIRKVDFIKLDVECYEGYVI